MLSEGRGKQLFWLILIILIVLLIFWGIATFFFHDNSFSWQDLVALFIDPGSFGGEGKHDLFRLIASTLGIFLFSAFLVSAVSNIFENIGASYQQGLSRYRHKDHILVLGGGTWLVSMLAALLNDDSKSDQDIVVLTSQSVDDLRSRLFTLPFLDIKKTKELKNRLTIYYGSRDNETDLVTKNLAKNAEVIYIIGEDNEAGHDSISIRCCQKLKTIITGSDRPTRCFMVLQDADSIDVYKYVKDVQSSSDTNLRVDVIDANAHIAEHVLRSNPPVITETDNKYVHLVVAGSSPMARTMAISAAHLYHFPNFMSGHNRTVISFVDSGMKDQMDRFVASLPSLFQLSHYRYISFDDKGERAITSFKPDSEYGDFQDIEWEFIDANIYSPNFRSLLKEWVKDARQLLSIALCNGEMQDNVFSAIHLPRAVYDEVIPIYVHQCNYSDVLKQASATGLFGNLIMFGMTGAILNDPLFITRSEKGQRVNYIYNQAYDTVKYPNEVIAWYNIKEAHKYSSIFSAYALDIHERNFGISETHCAEGLSDTQRTSLYETEHRRWMMSELLLGYSPTTIKEREAWKSLRLSSDEEIKEQAKAEYKNLKDNKFIHYDITPYWDLIPSEQKKDKIIIDRLLYISSGVGFQLDSK